MTQQEVNRVINQTIDKVITIKTAAEMLGLSERQVLRLKGGVLNHGPSFLIHKNRSPSTRTLFLIRFAHIVSLKQTKYPSANFAHFPTFSGDGRDPCELSHRLPARWLRRGLKAPKIHRQKRHTIVVKDRQAFWFKWMLPLLPGFPMKSPSHCMGQLMMPLGPS